MDKKEIVDILNEAYFSEKRHEKELIALLPTFLGKTTTTFVDVGASLGQYAYFVNQFLCDGKIYAIEPDPIRYEQLRENCEKWQAASRNRIVAVHAAVTDQSGPVTFYSTESNVSGGLFKHSDTPRQVEWHEVTVDGIVLDHLLTGEKSPFIKMDVEGAELRALRGSEQLLRTGAARFLIEVHPWTDETGQDNARQVFQLLASHGYRGLLFHGHYLFVRTGWQFIRLWLMSWGIWMKERLRSRLGGTTK